VKDVAGEELEIPKCPICGGRHMYRLKVERTYFSQLKSIISLRERSQPVRITRIFMCPVKNEKFQASFVLYQTSSAQIKSVTVGGVVEYDEKQ
jgi:hypothetical protein